MAEPAAKSETVSPNRNLAVRATTALVGVPLILLLLLKGPSWGFYMLVLPASIIGAYELFSMTHPGDRPSQAMGVAMTVGASLGTYFGVKDPRVLLTTLLVVSMFGPLSTLIRLGDIKTAALRASAMSMGPLFIGSSLALMGVMKRDLGARGPGFVLLTFFFAWMSDTGGYFAGRFLGKHKLYEAVSPKKTVEGAIGGLAGGLFGMFLTRAVLLPDLPLLHGVPLALGATALGQAGDLGESVLKRSTGVKDSGAIVPGHGGILDRVDALMMTSVVVYLYVVWTT
ncbi:MAG: phosphatidate cytidylyltransferase [Myxococcales bacterium]|nr:phosphatidate cytidylyltransferase [Myxococcales bacterium]HQY65471.1 phosphatidate cytidylyltransferase [Polyangiaceae bacterium]